MTRFSPYRPANQPKLIGLAWVAMTSMAISGYGLVSFLIGSADESTTITIPFRAVVGAIALFLVGYSFLASKRPRWPYWLFVVFMAAYGMRMFTDVYVDPNVLAKQTEFLFGVCVLPSIAIYMANRQENHKRLTDVLFIMYFVIAILGATRTNLAAEKDLDTGRLWANSVYNPIDLGHAAVSLMLISTHRLLRVNRIASYPAKLILYGMAGIAAGITFFRSGSRGPAVACGICFGLLLLSASRWRARGGDSLRRFTIPLTVIALIGLGVVVTSRYGEFLEGRLQTSSSEVDAEARTFLYDEALEITAQYPITGYTTVSSTGLYPHNVELEAAMSLGIPGAAAMLVFLFAVIYRSLRLVPLDNDTGLLALLAIQQIVSAQFSGGIWSDDNLWTTSMLVLSMSLPRAKSAVRRVWAVRIAPPEAETTQRTIAPAGV